MRTCGETQSSFAAQWYDVYEQTMNAAVISFDATHLTLMPSGALWWPDERLLAVGDLHLGKAERIARRGGGMLPPYETRDTLVRLEMVVRATNPAIVVSLGDAFDDLGAARALDDDVHEMICRLAAGRRFIWVAGNHDPGPVDLPGTCLAELSLGSLSFRHIADRTAGSGEISAHYHPKFRSRLRGQYIARPCFIVGNSRLILPAFGTYTGGLDATSPVFERLMGPEPVAYLTGKRITKLPLRLPA